MIMKILGLVAAVVAVSAPAFADENMEDAFRPRPPFHREMTCFARNALGRTFAARGNFRTPRFVLERQALNECFRGSLPIIKRTCREVGCR